MLKYIEGDLLTSDCTVIMHQANCLKVMGAGIAKSISNLYPEASLADKQLKLNSLERFGKYSFAITNNGVTIVNLYGQLSIGPGLQTNYEKLESAIDSFLTFAKNEDSNINTNKVGVPYKIGCGLAGGNWDVVKNTLDKLSEKHKVDIHIYKI